MLSWIRDADVAEAEFGGRFAAVEGAARIERDHRRFREHPVESGIVNLANALRLGRVVAAEAVLVGENEIEMPAVAQRSIRDQAVDGLEIVGFDPEAAVVPLFYPHILHRQRAERVERSARRLHARGNIFEPCLVGGDLDSLARLRSSPCLDDALPALPGEFVIVPDGDERPTRSRVLQIGIGKVALVDDAIALDRERVMKIAGLTAIGNAADGVDRAVVPRLQLLGIFDDFVNEITEVENETELI